MEINDIQQEDSFNQVLKIAGIKLQMLRFQRGYKFQKHFALDFGLPIIQYWKIESGKSNFSLKSLHKILMIHNITVEKFLSKKISIESKEYAK